MVNVALAVILHEGRVIVEQLQDSIKPEFRGVPAVLPGGRVRENELPQEAVVREVAHDTGVRVEVVEKIAEREHPLLPGSTITYFSCELIGSSKISGRNSKKVSTSSWVDIPTAAVLMLTLFTQVLYYMMRAVYGNTLQEGTTLPKLPWLKQNLLKLGIKIRKGELVAFPTETVYGLGANAFNAEAVAAIFRAKNRPADNPLIVHVASLESLEQVVQPIDSLTQRIITTFTPGPITVLMPKSERIPDIVTAGSSLVGVRIPAHQFALEFLAAAQVPVAAPSANKSGKPSATHHTHVVKAFGDEVPNIVKAGKTTFGVESTVVLPKNKEEIVIMRQGAVSKETIQQFFPQHNVVIAGKDDKNLEASPGTRYRHYAPNAVVKILPLKAAKQLVKMMQEIYNAQKEKNIVIICSSELAKNLPYEYTKILIGSRYKKNELLSNLYDALLQCDERRADIVIVESFSEVGIGRTLMERIRRAAAG